MDCSGSVRAQKGGAEARASLHHARKLSRKSSLKDAGNKGVTRRDDKVDPALECSNKLTGRTKRATRSL